MGGRRAACDDVVEWSGVGERGTVGVSRFVREVGTNSQK